MTPKEINKYSLTKFIDFLEAEYLVSPYKASQFKLSIEKYYKKTGMFQPIKDNGEEKCPKCGCQIYDPFDGEIIIHDVENCHYYNQEYINNLIAQGRNKPA